MNCVPTLIVIHFGMSGIWLKDNMMKSGTGGHWHWLFQSMVYFTCNACGEQVKKPQVNSRLWYFYGLTVSSPGGETLHSEMPGLFCPHLHRLSQSELIIGYLLQNSPFLWKGASAHINANIAGLWGGRIQDSYDMHVRGTEVFSCNWWCKCLNPLTLIDLQIQQGRSGRLGSFSRTGNSIRYL